MDLCRKISPDTGYVDVTPFPIGYSDFSFLIWFTPLKPELKNVKTIFCYERGTSDKNYQFRLDLAADGKLTFHCSNEANTLSTGDNLQSLETVLYDKINVVAVVRKHNSINLYLNNGLSGTFKTREIIKCYSYEADDNGNQIYFRLGAKTDSDSVATNEFDGIIDRFVFKLEAFDESVITAYGSDLNNNFATSYTQQLPSYGSQQDYYRLSEDLPPPPY